LKTRLTILFLIALAATSCEFDEVAIPDGEPLVVVYSVVRPDRDRQWVLVEQTLTGSTAQEDTASSVIPGDEPPVPITGATVTITNLTLTTDPCGQTSFTETPADPGLARSLGLYWGPANCPTMRGGDTLLLRVETADGLIVTGRTEVVDANNMFLRANGTSVDVPGPSLLMNRDLDTLEAEVDAQFGRSVHVEIARPDSLNVLDPHFFMFLDTTAITVPGNLVNFFDEFFDDDDDSTSNDSPESIFEAGRYHTVTVALVDDHFFDYMRTGNTPLSGRGFVNHIEGGMGIFGCLTAAANEVKVVGDLDDDREGVYQLIGTVNGVAVDIELELYVANAGLDTTRIGAFVEGDWVFGALETSAGGIFEGGDMALTIYQVDPANPDSVAAILIGGSPGTGGSFSLSAYDRQLNQVGTLTATRN